MSADRKQPGDLCDCGGAKLRVYSSRDLGEFQQRYIECRACGLRFRQVVRAETVKRRTQASDGMQGES